MNAPNHPRIAVDPGVCGGKPTVAGTRVRVADVLELLAEGVGDAEILADFPYLTGEDVRACLSFAAAAVGGSGLAPGHYTPETLPPLSEGAKAILASIDAVAPLVDVRTETKGTQASPGIEIEDPGIAIELSDEPLPGFDPDR
jgi:uncharacterized protein (DUF433 family)